MKIRVNGADREIAEGLTIAALLVELQLDPRYLAVEKNQELVPRGKHAQTILQDRDDLEIVTMVGGG